MIRIEEDTCKACGVFGAVSPQHVTEVVQGSEKKVLQGHCMVQHPVRLKEQPDTKGAVK